MTYYLSEKIVKAHPETGYFVQGQGMPDFNRRNIL
jgi:hypothetical protein